MPRKKTPAKKSAVKITKPARSSNLVREVSSLIDSARLRVYNTANAEYLLLNWNIGSLVKTEILKNKRAGYGQKVVKNLSVKLTDKYGRGWSERQIWNCVRSAYTIELDPYPGIAFN